MLFKKILFVCYPFFFLSTLSYAAPKKINQNKINLDIIGTLGYLNYGGYKEEKSNYESSRSFTGYSVNGILLYQLNRTSLGSFVLGGGLNYSKGTLDGVKIVSSYLLPLGVSTGSMAISSFSLLASGGYKFMLTPRFSLFTLGQFGYAFYNNKILKIEGRGNDIIFEDTDAIKNHYQYGLNALAMYLVNSNLSVGGGFQYMKHMASINKESASFNEYTFNIALSYSI